MTPWRVTWHACFGALSKTRADAIEIMLGDKLKDGLRPDELDKAVNAIAEAWDFKTNGNSPGIGMLYKAINNARKVERGINIEEPYEFTQAKRMMRNLHPHDLDRWDLICSMCGLNGGNDWAFALERYAAKNGGFTLPWFVDLSMHPLASWQQPNPEGVAGWVDAVREFAKSKRAA